jgi:hypothetical protein
MTQKRRDEVRSLIEEVEGLAKGLRSSLRKQAAALPKDLKALAGRLRKRAAHAAGQVEKYAHEIRIELENGKKKPGRMKRTARVTVP